MKDKAIIYTRVSTDDQAENGISLDAQKKQCHEKALQLGYEVVKVFSDPGYSGATFKRPGLQEMLSLIKNDATINTLFVQHTDRLARDVGIHQIIRKELREHNVNLYALNQGKIEDTPEANMTDGILSVVSAYQRENIAYKTEKALEQKAIDGWLPRKPPLGYKNIRDEDGNNIIAIDEEKAPLIKLAFKLYIAGEYGAETINNILYAKGLRSMTGKKLAVSKMYYLLENPFYIGWFRWHKKPHKGNHLPLIGEDTFVLAQKIRHSRTIRKNYERKHFFLLSGSVFCKCGYQFTAEKHTIPSGRKYAYYHCTRGKKCHDSHNVSCQELEKQVEEKFKEVQFSENFYQELTKKLKQKYNNHKEETTVEVISLTKKKQEVEKKRNKIEELFFSGEIKTEVYKRNSEKFDDEIKIYEEQILKLSQQKNINIGLFEELADFAKNIYEIYKQGDERIKRKYLCFFWEKFIVEDKKIVKAVPTLLFKALQELQNPPYEEDSIGGKLNCNLIKDTTNNQAVTFIPSQKKFGNEIINPTVWGGYWGLNPE